MIRALIADDEKIVQDSIKFIISNEFGQNIDIVTCSSGKEALEHLLLETFHIAYIDVKMPDLDGLELLEEYRRIKDSEFPLFIIVSAYDKFEFAKKALKEKAYSYILKPYSIEDIVKITHSAIRNITQIMNKTRENIEKNTQFIMMRNLLENSFLPTFLFKHYIETFDLNQYENIFGISLKSGFLALIFLKEKNDLIYDFKEIDLIRKDLKMIFEDKVLTSIGMGEYLICFFATNSDKETQFIKDKFIENISQKSYFNNIKIGFSNFYYLTDGYETAFWEAYYNAIQIEINNNEVEDSEELLSVVSNLEAKLLYAINHFLPISTIETYLGQLFKYYTELFGMQNIKYKSIKLLIMILLEANINHNLLSNEIEKTIAQLLFSREDDLLAITKDAILKLISISKNNHDLSIRNDSISKAIDIIKEHYNQDISLHEISNLLGFNPYYFSKLFKKYTGITFKSYLRKVRIDKACELLKTSSKSIKEVSYEVGFSDPNYFIKIFKSFVGVTPAIYKSEKNKSDSVI